MDFPRIMLNQLESRFTVHPHVFATNIPIEDWNKADRPYVWSVVDEKDNVTLLLDTGYGMLALFVNNELHDVGSSFVISNNREYVGLSESYLGDKCSLYKKL